MSIEYGFPEYRANRRNPLARYADSRLFLQISSFHRQVPMRVEDFEAALLFPLKCFLIGVHLLLQRGLVEWLVGDGGVLEDDGHAIVPAPVFGGVVARLVQPDFGDAAEFHLFFK